MGYALVVLLALAGVAFFVRTKLKSQPDREIDAVGGGGSKEQKD